MSNTLLPGVLPDWMTLREAFHRSPRTNRLPIREIEADGDRVCELASLAGDSSANAVSIKGGAPRLRVSLPQVRALWIGTVSSLAPPWTIDELAPFLPNLAFLHYSPRDNATTPAVAEAFRDLVALGRRDGVGYAFSGVEKLRRLRYLDLDVVRSKDITPIAELGDLEMLRVSGAKGWGALKGLAGLADVDCDSGRTISAALIESWPSLRRLTMRGVPLKAVTGATRVEQLELGTQAAVVDELAELPASLLNLTLLRECDARSLSTMPNLQDLTLNCEEGGPLTIPSLPRLERLSLHNVARISRSNDRALQDRAVRHVVDVSPNLRYLRGPWGGQNALSTTTLAELEKRGIQLLETWMSPWPDRPDGFGP